MHRGGTVWVATTRLARCRTASNRLFQGYLFPLVRKGPREETMQRNPIPHLAATPSRNSLGFALAFHGIDGSCLRFGSFRRGGLTEIGAVGAAAQNMFDAGEKISLRGTRDPSFRPFRLTSFSNGVSGCRSCMRSTPKSKRGMP